MLIIVEGSRRQHLLSDQPEYEYLTNQQRLSHCPAREQGVTTHHVRLHSWSEPATNARARSLDFPLSSQSQHRSISQLQMEHLSPAHPMSPIASPEQKLINRETGTVDIGLTPSDASRIVGRCDERGERTVLTSPAPAISTSNQLSPSSFALVHSSPVQQYSPPQAEIDQHPIRQRLSLSREHVAASGWETKQKESKSPGIGRQENIEAVEGARDGNMTEVKEGDKGMWLYATAMGESEPDATAYLCVRLRGSARIAQTFLPEAPKLLTRAHRTPNADSVIAQLHGTGAPAPLAALPLRSSPTAKRKWFPTAATRSKSRAPRITPPCILSGRAMMS